MSDMIRKGIGKTDDVVNFRNIDVNGDVYTWEKANIANYLIFKINTKLKLSNKYLICRGQKPLHKPKLGPTTEKLS